MKTLLIGVGRQGKRILELLVEQGFENICLYDTNTHTLENLKNRFSGKVFIEKTDVCNLNESERINYLSGFDFIVDCLPSSFSWRILNSASKTKTAVLSVSFLEEDFMKLDAQAKASGTIIIPDCGAAPGFSHLLAGHSVNKLGGADSVVMKVGAIPETPLPPFYHSLTWSIDDLLEEYVRPAKVRVDGKIERVNPFDNIIKEKICGLKLESFITDGARSFLSSFPNVKNMEERTLRHPGHLSFMKTLIDNSDPQPRRSLSKILETNFGNLPKEDLFVMEIIVSKGECSIRHNYLLKYDHANKVHALVNSVAITAVQTFNIIREGMIKKTGVYPLELLASDEIYESISRAHKNIGAKLEITTL